MTDLESLAEQFQRLHQQLPTLTFNPDIDLVTPSTAAISPEATTYLNHYRLNSLTDKNDIRHFLGSAKCGSYTVACQYWLPPAAAGTVFVIHGYFDHSGLYRHLFQYLLNKNFAVVTFDLPGHGLSDGEQASIASFDHYVEVFESLLVMAQSKLPKPWHCVGQSTGGAIALKHLLDEKPEKHLFSNIALLAPLLLPRRWQFVRLFHLLTHRFKSSTPRALEPNSNDPDFVDFLAGHDPLQANHIPLEWIGAMKHWIEEFRDLPPSDFPMHIVQGDLDSTLNWRYNLKQFSGKLPLAKIHVIKGARHHLANEIERIRAETFAAMGFEHD